MKTLFVPKEQRVNKFTRAGKHGKIITCPKCHESAPIYHFAWSALCCIHCDAAVNKLDWRLADAN